MERSTRGSGVLRWLGLLLFGAVVGAGVGWAQAPAAAAPVAAPSAPTGFGATVGAAAGQAQGPTGINPQGSPQTNAAGSNNANNNNSNNANSNNAQNQQQLAGQQNQHAETPTRMPESLTEFQQLVAATTGRTVPIYGAGLFGGSPSTFAPIDNAPVPADYVIEPGDELRIQTWGQLNTGPAGYGVDRTGAITITGLAPIHVAGLQFSEIEKVIYDRLAAIYKGFRLNVDMGALRTIQVDVMGYAASPGSYSIGSLSTLINVLRVTGGPSTHGSMRDIQVKRGANTVLHFDVYDFLQTGDKSKDIKLEPGDVIFIPVVGPQVAIVGSVNTQAIFEMKPGQTTTQQLLELAGGETSVAVGAQVRLERIFEHTIRSLQDVNLSGPPVTLQNGDIVSVTSIVNRFREVVTLRGNVANPGRMVWRPGMRVRDLIPSKEALITRDYWNRQNALGQRVQDYQPGEASLQVGAGGGNAPGVTNPTIGSGASLGVALTQNNGMFGAKNDVVLSAPDIDWNYASITRLNTGDLTTTVLTFNLGKAVLDGDDSQNLELLAGDIVTIFSKEDILVPSSQRTRFVRLLGEFTAAGVYPVLPGETLRQLITRVGGFTPDAYLYASEFTRESIRRTDRQRLQEQADQLEAQITAKTADVGSRGNGNDAAALAASAEEARAAVARLRLINPTGRIVLQDLKPTSVGTDSIPDIALEDGDRFVVPRVPSNVSVEGQVYDANAFLYRANRRVINYLKAAGGPTREADKRRVFVVRASGDVVGGQYSHVERVPIYPGDTIIVPPMIDKHALFRNIMDISSLISSIGLTMGTTYLLIK